MNLLRRKVASFLIDAARQTIDQLDASSPCAQALQKLSVESALKEDINRLTAGLSVREMVRLLSLARKLRKARPDRREAIANELGKMGRDVVSRVEDESGPLKLPRECHELLLRL